MMKGCDITQSYDNSSRTQQNMYTEIPQKNTSNTSTGENHRVRKKSLSLAIISIVLTLLFGLTTIIALAPAFSYAYGWLTVIVGIIVWMSVGTIIVLINYFYNYRRPM